MGPVSMCGAAAPAAGRLRARAGAALSRARVPPTGRPVPCSAARRTHRQPRPARVRVLYKGRGEAASAAAHALSLACSARIPSRRCRSRAPHRAGTCSALTQPMAGTGGAASAVSAGPPAAAKNSAGTVKKLPLALFIFLSALVYNQIQPPPAKIPGTPGGPPVTANRTRLRDGRYLAYLESGVPKDKAKYNIIYVHGFACCRYDMLNVSQPLMEELGIYLLSFDRPGYAESDAHPGRTEKSIALDIQDLADNLQLGPKFHLIGFSMGGEIMWSCLKYIPHRLAGVAILGPVGNYWWSGFPPEVVKEAWYVQFPRDRRAVWVSHHLPWLTHWWNTQKLFPGSGVKVGNQAILSKEDQPLIHKFRDRPYNEQVTQQGEHDCLHRDMMVGFGKWDWSPLEMENPFAGTGEDLKVHLWHGVEDLYVPVQLSRYISKKLPWVTYHELPTAGHLFPAADGMPDRIVRSLLLGEE